MTLQAISTEEAKKLTEGGVLASSVESKPVVKDIDFSIDSLVKFGNLTKEVKITEGLMVT